MSKYEHPRCHSDRQHLSSLLVEEFLTPAQASRRLRMTTERLRQLAVDGTLPSIETPLGRLFARIDIVRFAEKQQHPARSREVS